MLKNIKNFMIYNKTVTLVLAGVLSVTSLIGCSNKKTVDFRKTYNVAVEVNDDLVSLVGISKYSIQNGNQIQFITDDGLIVRGTGNTQLLYVNSKDKLENYAESLAGKDGKIINYNDLQNISFNYDDTMWNFEIVYKNTNYNKAIVLENNRATIVDVKSWSKQNDDVVKLRADDGLIILVPFNDVKLVNDLNASDNSLENYTLSLVGTADNISYYPNKGIVKEK